MRRLAFREKPPLAYCIGNRCIGRCIVQACSRGDRRHHPPLPQPAAGHARQLDAQGTGLPLDLGLGRHNGVLFGIFAIGVQTERGLKQLPIQFRTERPVNQGANLLDDF